MIMTIKINMFGIAREIFGESIVAIDSADANTFYVSQLKRELEKQQPRLKELGSYMIAVNNEYAADEMPVKEKDEIAVIPPVSGG